MRPAHTHGSAHRVDLVARPSQPARRQLIRRTPAEAPGPRHGVDGGRCHGRCTRPAPTPAADVPRSTSGPTPPAEPCPPTAPHRRSHAEPAPVCAAPRSPRRQRPRQTRSELGIPITNQVPQPAEIVAELHEEVPGLLDHPLPHRMRCHREHVDPAGRHSIANRTYSRRNKTVSTVKKSTASTPLAWPAGTAARSTPTAPEPEHPGALQDGPHGAGPDQVPKAAQLAVDAAISPGRVLSCQP